MMCSSCDSVWAVDPQTHAAASLLMVLTHGLIRLITMSLSCHVSLTQQAEMIYMLTYRGAVK